MCGAYHAEGHVQMKTWISFLILLVVNSSFAQETLEIENQVKLAGPEREKAPCLKAEYDPHPNESACVVVMALPDKEFKAIGFNRAGWVLAEMSMKWKMQADGRMIVSYSDGVVTLDIDPTSKSDDQFILANTINQNGFDPVRWQLIDAIVKNSKVTYKTNINTICQGAFGACLITVVGGVVFWPFPIISGALFDCVTKSMQCFDKN